MKIQIFKNNSLPLRADKFIQLHLVNAKLCTENEGNEDCEAHEINNNEKTSFVNQKNESENMNHHFVNNSEHIISQSITNINDDFHNVMNCSDHGSAEQTNSTTACPACKNNDTPGGTHLCVICAKVVHTLNFCSYLFDHEEDYGMKRIYFASLTASNLKKNGIKKIELPLKQTKEKSIFKSEQN